MAFEGITDFLGIGGGGNLVSLAWIFLIFVIAVGIVGIVFFIVWRKLKWNLKVEFKIPRGISGLSEGESLDPDEVHGIINKEWGKGVYDKKRGVVFVKRKGIHKSPLRPFNVTKYIGGNNVLSVVQTGIDEYRPILEESYLEMIDDKTGEEATLLNIKMDTTESRSWRNTFERETKSVYSISSLIREYAPWISIGLVIFLWGIQFVVIYTKVT